MIARKVLVALGLAAMALPPAASAAPPGYDDPLARIEGRLCPGVSGIRTDAALQIVDRIREDAQRIGIELADPDSCEPNMLVFFVDDTGQTLDTLMEKRPSLFGTFSAAERRKLKSDTGSARAWSQVVTRSRDGMKIDDPDNLVQVPRTSMWGAHSKIYVPVRREILTSVVLFDNQDILGKTINQLADYAAMRSFANDFTAYKQDRGSILTLFDGSGPSELTETDMVFLKTLYSGIPNMPGRFKKRSLSQALDDDIAGNVTVEPPYKAE